MEYWPMYYEGHSNPIYHVASKSTGDIECKPGTDCVLEFDSVGEVLATYPGATYCHQMAMEKAHA